MLDRVDLKILSVLQREGKTSIVELAERVGLSTTPCRRRVERMEAEGIIQGYVALLNPTALGLGVSVFVHVRLNQQRTEAIKGFEETVARSAEIVECHLVSGDYDYLLRVRASDVNGFKHFVREQLLNLPSIAQTSSAFILESIKQTTAMALPGVKVK